MAAADLSKSYTVTIGTAQRVASGLIYGHAANVQAAYDAGPTAISEQVDWRGLQQTRRFRKSVRYRRAYDAVGNAFLSLGDAFVSRVLKLQPEV
jgi:hypothetical protein